MPSLDFDREQSIFRSYYDNTLPHFERILNAAMAGIRKVILESGIGEVAKIEGRIKDREECLRKFQRKYQSRLEAAEQPYDIRDYISDLIGIRIVCLYDDQIPLVAALLKEHFRVLDVTDKTTAVESSEDIFGYKGLHMDLALDEPFRAGGKNLPYGAKRLEVQIRTLIQDAWSVLDHKIKYKKSIPSDLKRRINVLSALFELADREFKAIRDETSELMQQATVAPVVDQPDERNGELPAAAADSRVINAFSFLRIAGHFFRDFDFNDDKVDDFVQDILKLNSGFQKSELHRSLIENLKTVRDYRDDFMADNPNRSFSPYTMIRHCLYLYDRESFARILSRGPLERFLGWLGNDRRDTPAPQG